MTTSCIDMHPCEQSLCSPSHPVVVICFFLFCQVSFRRRVQSVSPVMLEPTQLTGTVKTAAMTATEIADQVQKL